MKESTRPMYYISLLFHLVVVLLFTSKYADGGHVLKFDKASSPIDNESFPLNSTNTKMEIPPALDVTSAATSTLTEPNVRPEKLYALSPVFQLPKMLISNNLAHGTLVNKLKKSASKSEEEKDNLIKNLSINDTEKFSTPQRNKKYSNLKEMQIKNETILPYATSTSNRTDEGTNICIEEDCVIAAATIISSLDRTVNPCENFYDFACGGWMKKALELSTDRFQMIDKRNAKLLENILDPKHFNGNIDPSRDLKTAKGKATAFYKSCVHDSEGQDKGNLHDLLTFILQAGGASLGTLKDNTLNEKTSFNKRVQTMHTKFGLNVLFTWGVVDLHGKNRIAIISGGFNEEWNEETFERQDYLKIMKRIVNLLLQSQDDSITVGWDYDSETSNSFNDTDINSSNSSLDITYEYSEITEDYNLPYDYNEGPRNNDRSTMNKMGETLLDLFKKPIKWTTPLNESDKMFTKLDDSGSLRHFNQSNNNRTVKSYPLQYNYNRTEDSFISPKNDIIENLSSEHHKYTVHEKTRRIKETGIFVPPNENVQPLINVTAKRLNMLLSLCNLLHPYGIEFKQIFCVNMERKIDEKSVSFDSNDESLENQLQAILEVRKRIEVELTKVIEFEEKLAKISPKEVMLRPDMLTPYSIDSLSDEFPFLDWREFFDTSLQNSVEEDADIQEMKTFPNDTEVLVQEEFLRGVNEIVLEYRNLSTERSMEEGNDILTNYMIWRLIAAFYPDRPIDEAERKSKCLKDTEDMFAPAVTAMFVESKGRNKSKHLVQEVDEMVNTMKSAFKENLPQLKWMSNRSLSAAESKLEQMVDLIGYPEFVLNSSWVDSIYSELSITEDSYLMNTVAHRAFSRKLEIKEYFSSQDNGNWKGFSLDFSSNIATVNAYYNPTSNTMVVPIGMLQPPLFWSKPKSLTFGAFGIVVAHEITHAFDDVGIQYDSTGSFRALYDNETLSKFHEASDCVRRQYSNYTIGNRDGDPTKFFRVDGNITLGENIADHGGLKIAEIAYEKWLTTQPNGERDVVLPALENFSDEQLFYLGYALPWCAVHTETLMRNHVIKDEHAPDRFRVIGPLSNSEKFARAWSCPNDGSSRMNPKGKCKVW